VSRRCAEDQARAPKQGGVFQSLFEIELHVVTRVESLPSRSQSSTAEPVRV
jgi:hypothetical protein